MDKNKNLNEYFLEKIRKDEYVNSFLHELDEETIEANIPLLYQTVLDNQRCNDCKGKKVCSKDEHGYQTVLNLIDGKVIKKLTPCEYLPTYNFDLIDLMYLKPEMFKGEVDVNNSSRKYFFEKAISIASNNDRKGTFLYGKYGTGKTFLTFNLVTKLAKKGKTVVFCLAPELIRQIKTNILVPTYMDKLLIKLKKADILVLDDLGGELNSAFSRDEVLFPVLDSRMNDYSKITFATSNLSMKELEEHFADEKNKIDPIGAGRIMERIRSIMDPIELDGINYRHDYYDCLKLHIEDPSLRLSLLNRIVNSNNLEEIQIDEMYYKQVKIEEGIEAHKIIKNAIDNYALKLISHRGIEQLEENIEKLEIKNFVVANSQTVLYYRIDSNHNIKLEPNSKCTIKQDDKLIEVTMIHK